MDTIDFKDSRTRRHNFDYTNAGLVKILIKYKRDITERNTERSHVFHDSLKNNNKKVIPVENWTSLITIHSSEHGDSSFYLRLPRITEIHIFFLLDLRRWKLFIQLRTGSILVFTNGIKSKDSGVRRYN